MPPLITREEAHRLGEIEDRAEIEALVERAWRVRVERFADATDMRSPVDARSGGRAALPPRSDGAPNRGHGRPTREHDEAALAGVADDGHGGPRR